MCGEPDPYRVRYLIGGLGDENKQSNAKNNHIQNETLMTVKPSDIHIFTVFLYSTESEMEPYPSAKEIII